MKDYKLEEVIIDSDARIAAAARRNFIKSSGGLAIAAPAVVLLLSASKPAVAKDHYTNSVPSSPNPKKTLLDP